MRVLCVSRNFPNPLLPRLGLWADRLLRACTPACDFKVIAPIPYAPPLPGFHAYTRFRAVPPSRWDDGVEVFHPRFLTAPGQWLHGVEHATQYFPAERVADRIRTEFPFDLVHAHFTYPDGVVGARLAERYTVPLIISEHALWEPWMEHHPRVRRHAVRAAARASFHLAASQAARDSIARFTGDSPRLRIVPNLVDERTFRLPAAGTARDSKRLLFVGLIRRVKGVDVLLHALRRLLDAGRDLRLKVVGDSFYESYRREIEGLKMLSRELRVADRVEFAGGKPSAEVAVEMGASAALVLPSRRESFGAVLAEALACGTPVVATDCGGPRDIVSEAVGTLVPPEDPAALALGIERVLTRAASYEPARLRAHSLERFGSQRIAARMIDVYREALANRGADRVASAAAH